MSYLNTYRIGNKNYLGQTIEEKRKTKDYIKTIELNYRGRTIKFKFKIKEEYSHDYKIYILKTPKDPTIYGAHRAHYLGYGDEKYICWDEPIRSFKDANAIMFCWCRNFRDNCMKGGN